MNKFNNTESVLYNLHIFTQYDDTLKKNFIVFRIETVKEFENYVYEIDVNFFQRGNELIFRMRGLKPIKIYLPGGGRAFYEKKIECLQGNFKVEIIGINKKVNSFEININDDLVKIITYPRDSFLNIQVN